MIFGFDKSGSFTSKDVLHLNLAVLVCQWVFTIVIIVRVHLLDSQNASALKYRQQLRLYVAVFLFLTGWMIVGYAGGLVRAGASVDAYVYITDFPGSLYYYMGLANALIWGLSATCVKRCVDKCCGGSVGAFTADRNTLELPLLSADGQRDSGMSSCCSDTWPLERTARSVMLPCGSETRSHASGGSCSARITRYRMRFA